MFIFRKYDLSIDNFNGTRQHHTVDKLTANFMMNATILTILGLAASALSNPMPQNYGFGYFKSRSPRVMGWLMLI